MNISRGRIRRTAAGGAALAVALSLTGLPGAAAAPAETVKVLSAAEQAPAPSRLTLITGDTLAVTTGADGRQSADIVSEAGTSKQFQISSGKNGDLYVYPEDVLPAVAAGMVDPELFNVTQLLKDGYGDAGDAQLPAVVDFGGSPGPAVLDRQSRALPSARTERVMSRLGMTAVDIDKSGAKKFWQAVKPVEREGGRAGGAAAVVPGSSGVAKVWYDGRAKVQLDQSVPQIGAPQAWAEGYDGAGVKVAVLDTGADLTNADIAPRIVADQSFVSGESVQDGHGHGTHVASTIAGSGANSGGKYKGVAPAADLLIGKVLDNAGSGSDADILAGMDWAVGQGADIVSMSLGGPAVAGGDVLSQAVDSLSASSHTLFVIAAGNSGPDESTLGTPGIADSALTVGAVDKTDVLASFSSRGPRLGDNAIKPDITAPGVGIVAARAAGTAIGTPVGDYYTTLSGTSMATPHVAGAAAILAERHPDWTGRQLKDALTAHSRTSASYTPFQQGYGRVDVPAAVDSTLELTGGADFGLVPFQKGTYPRQTRTLTVTNAGSADATLDVAPTVKDGGGAALAEGALTLSGADLSGGRLTVPAGGSADVTVTLDPNGLASGQYTGYVTATAGSGEQVHVPVAFAMDVLHHDVTIDVKDRFGNAPYLASLTIHGMDNNYWQSGWVYGGQSSTTLSVPVGRYSIEGELFTGYPGDPKRTYATDLFDLPDIDATEQDRTFTVDGTTATDATVKITGEKRPLERATYMNMVTRDDGAGGHSYFIATAGLLNGADGKFGAVPSQQATTGTLHLYDFVSQQQPLLQLSVTSPEHTSIPVTESASVRRFQGTKNVQLVDAGAGSAEDFAAIDATGKAVLVSAADLSAVDDQARRAAAAGAVAVIVAPTAPDPLSSGSVAADLTVPVADTGYDSGRKLISMLARGKVTIALQGVLQSGYTYSTQFAEDGRIPTSLARTANASDFVRVENTYHADQTRHLGYTAVHVWSPDQATSFKASQYTTMGGSTDDYLLASPDLSYAQNVFPSTMSSSYFSEPRATYPTPGRTYRKVWLAGPMHPSVLDPTACAFCRTDVWARTTGVVGGDSDPAHQLLSGPASSWTYYRGGQQITDTKQLFVPQQADYTFVQDLTRAQDHPGVTLGGKIHTEWHVTSAAPTTMAVKGCDQYLPKPTVCESMPAVMIDYHLQLDLLNQAPAGRAFVFTVDGDRPSGWSGGSTAMAGATVSVSYDDGATWQPTTVLRKGDHSFQVVVKHPRLAETNGFVTLRTEVRDTAGDRTVQTLTRAYALK
ncbi:S8 family serine peptidase [Peterkaempfera sp. SMS 1(5)a]|uniref:S8 family peptidase n=1 Tax=Peterkaempfera podocarpi TaxID=3232308 RepID=UPI00366AE402